MLCFPGTTVCGCWRDPPFTARKTSDLQHPRHSAESRRTRHRRLGFNFLAKAVLACSRHWVSLLRPAYRLLTCMVLCMFILFLVHPKADAKTGHLHGPETPYPKLLFQTLSANLTRNFSSYKPCLPFRLKQVKWLYYQHHSAVQLQYSIRPFLSVFAIFPQLLYLFTDLGFPHSFRRRVPHGMTPLSRLPQCKNQYLLKDKLKLLFFWSQHYLPLPSLQALAVLAVKQNNFWGY